MTSRTAEDAIIVNIDHSEKVEKINTNELASRDQSHLQKEEVAQQYVEILFNNMNV